MNLVPTANILSSLLLIILRNHIADSFVPETTHHPHPDMKTLPKVYVHSTFRDERGRAVRPEGLEWDVDGDSHVRFAVPNSGHTTSINRHEIVHAYNRWCCAKDLPYKTEDDIESIAPQGSHHVQVEWKQNDNHVEKVILNDGKSIEELLREDEAIKEGTSPAEVWINGDSVGSLNSADDLEGILAKIPKTANKLCYKRAAGRIYIERYYSSFLRRPQAWDHVWDNIVALEDPQIIDDTTVIGTATLSDWIMGGQLTSRLWIQDKGDSILFLRPLYDDDMETADRRYEISNDESPEKMEMVRSELERLRYLARLRHPYVTELLEQAKAKREARKVALSMSGEAEMLTG